jgi:hypothetical protein
MGRDKPEQTAVYIGNHQFMVSGVLYHEFAVVWHFVSVVAIGHHKDILSILLNFAPLGHDRKAFNKAPVMLYYATDTREFADTVMP